MAVGGDGGAPAGRGGIVIIQRHAVRADTRIDAMAKRAIDALSQDIDMPTPRELDNPQSAFFALFRMGGTFSYPLDQFEGDWPQDERQTRPYDPPLATDSKSRGVLEAAAAALLKQLSEAGYGGKIDVCLSSPYQRAVSTSAIVTAKVNKVSPTELPSIVINNDAAEYGGAAAKAWDMVASADAKAKAGVKEEADAFKFTFKDKDGLQSHIARSGQRFGVDGLERVSIQTAELGGDFAEEKGSGEEFMENAEYGRRTHALLEAAFEASATPEGPKTVLVTAHNHTVKKALAMAGASSGSIPEAGFIILKKDDPSGKLTVVGANFDYKLERGDAGK